MAGIVLARRKWGSVPRVLIGRVQRREISEPLELRPFGQDIASLVERERLSVTTGGHTWIASDLSYDVTGRFVTGVMGFSTRETIFRPDEEEFSWLKADVREEFGGTTATLTPFALDARDDNRYVAFVVRHRVGAGTFAKAFTALLQAAVVELGFVPAEWEVDLLPRLETLRDWVEDHPDIAELKRVVKFTNPSRRLDDDRHAMRELAAREKDERYHPQRGGRIDVSSEAFREFEEDAADGYVELTVSARSGSGRTTFSTRQERALEAYVIPNYRADLSSGISYVLEQLERFARLRSGDGELTLDTVLRERDDAREDGHEPEAI